MACNTNCNSTGLGCSSNKCEKVCIEVNRVFDANVQRNSLEDVVLDVTFPPNTPTTGLTVQSISNSGQGVVSDLVITPLAPSRRSRVSYTLTIPIVIVAADSVGTTYTGTASLVLTRDIIMNLPASGAIMSIDIEVAANLTGIPVSLSAGVLVANLCVILVTKAVAPVILVVPTYGYPVLPAAQPFVADVCSGILAQPLFPSGI